MSAALIKIFGLAILGALLCVLLRKWNGEVALILKVTCGVVLCVACISLLSPLVERIKELAETALGDVASEALSVLLRVLCVALLSHVCASICRDCGEGTIAYYAELGGKIEIMILCLPLFLDVLDIALELLEMSP
jgi:stage III sporulation protein AD